MEFGLSSRIGSRPKDSIGGRGRFSIEPERGQVDSRGPVEDQVRHDLGRRVNNPANKHR